MPPEHTSQSHPTRREHPRHDPFARIPQKPRATAGDGESSLLGVLKSALFALPVSLLCGVILLSVMAAIALTQPNPSAMITPLALAVLGLSGLVGGLVCVRRAGRSPALCGLTFGLLFVLVTWVLSLIPMEAGESTSLPGVWLIRAVVVLLSCLGAAVGARRAHRPTHHRGR